MSNQRFETGQCHWNAADRLVEVGVLSGSLDEIITAG